MSLSTVSGTEWMLNSVEASGKKGKRKDGRGGKENKRTMGKDTFKEKESN